MKKFFLPFALFLVVLGFLAVGLNLNPREVPSPLIGKPAPTFSLPVLGKNQVSMGSQDMRGKVWILNVWASWCVACQAEHPLLVEFAKRNSVALLGLNYKDTPQDAAAWLARFGDPYQLSLEDRQGQVGIDFGVYGVPETFVMDRDGIIRFKHIGPLTPEVIEQQIVPLIGQLNA